MLKQFGNRFVCFNNEKPSYCFFRQMATLYFKKLNQDKTALNRSTKDRANWQRNAAITFSQRAALQALY